MGLRSMKVKRMREAKAARARELWMKAESAAAGKRKRDKKRLESAIKIQVTSMHTEAQRKPRKPIAIAGDGAPPQYCMRHGFIAWDVLTLPCLPGRAVIVS